MPTFDEEMRVAARAAADAATEVMREYTAGYWRDEDDITPALAKGISAEVNRLKSCLTWKASVLRHRAGEAGQEKKVGADLVISITVDTPQISFAKGVLIQSKKVELNVGISKKAHADLQDQCNKMLSVSPGASYIFNYRRGSMRVGSAIVVAGSRSQDLNALLPWTPYRFFLEFFRCPIGDARIRTPLFEGLPVATKIQLTAQGDLALERPQPVDG